MIEVKIKEVDEKDVFPALYASENREMVILVKTHLPNGKLEGVIMRPRNQFGEYSMTWSSAKFKRMGRGSELTVKFTQQ